MQPRTGRPSGAGVHRLRGDLPAGGPDPDRPETWVFGEAPETTGWHDVPDPEESQP